MGLFGNTIPGLIEKQPPAGKSGEMRNATGAGPAIAAHSKDAKTFQGRQDKGGRWSEPRRRAQGEDRELAALTTWRERWPVRGTSRR
ncbi:MULTISPECIES: hypothetical protein [unclassified Mesorhizobium]|nr:MULTISPECIES: hypothetical protein [unclassified Mesorhizobium]